MPEVNETLQSNPEATLRVTPAVAATLLSPSEREPYHSRDLPALAIADSADLRPIRTLGEGGMGRVLLANQSSLDREVAVKSALRSDREAAHALILEAVITGKLEHPNIPPVHQLGRDEAGDPVLVMKRIEGARWSDLLVDREHPLRRDNPLFLRDELSAHLEILIQVSTALHYAHARGVFHRDVKPNNVMIGTFGEVYLIDWGVAWSDSIHGRIEDLPPSIVGSPAYMAPELARGERPDARTDVYLLGATLHQVLTGKYRHEGATAAEATRAALLSAPVAYGDEVPAELAALCNRATSPRREDRPESAFELVQAIRAHLTHRESIALTRRALDLLERATRDGEARLLTECRFALDEALRRWPDNAEASRTRARLLSVLVDRYLSDESPGAARAAVAELGGDAAYDERIRAVEERLEERKRLEQRALEAEREADVSAGQRAREVFFGFMILVVVVRTIYRAYYPFDRLDTRAQFVTLLEVALAMFLPPILGAVFAGRRLARTAAGRAVLRVVAIVGASIIMNRALGIVFQPPLLLTIILDCVLAAAGLVIASIAQGRWLLWGGAVAALTGVALVVVREHVALILNLGVLCAVAVLFVAQRHAARARPPHA